MPRPKKKSSSGRVKAAPGSSLASLRTQVDRIDNQILSALSARGKLVTKIGEAKAKAGGTYHAPVREREVLARLVKANPGPYSDEAIEIVFREIMSASLALENPLQVAFVSRDKGAAAAIQRRFGKSADARAEQSPQDALAAVTDGVCEYAVVCVEDSETGFSGTCLDALDGSACAVTGEIVLPVGDGAWARFLIMGRTAAAASGHDRTVCFFVTRNEPGGILRMLAPFSEHGVNLARLASRPIPGRRWEYRFYLELEGHESSPSVRAALGAHASGGAVFRVLGSYPLATREGE